MASVSINGELRVLCVLRMLGASDVPESSPSRSRVTVITTVLFTSAGPKGYSALGQLSVVEAGKTRGWACNCCEAQPSGLASQLHGARKEQRAVIQRVVQWEPKMECGQRFADRKIE